MEDFQLPYYDLVEPDPSIEVMKKVVVTDKERPSVMPTDSQVRLIFNQFFFLILTTGPTFAVRETTSLGMMVAPRVPPLNPSETIVF